MFSVYLMLRGLGFYHVDMGIHILWWDLGILAVLDHFYISVVKSLNWTFSYESVQILRKKIWDPWRPRSPHGIIYNPPSPPLWSRDIWMLPIQKYNFSSIMTHSTVVISRALCPALRVKKVSVYAGPWIWPPGMSSFLPVTRFLIYGLLCTYLLAELAQCCEPPEGECMF